ncbi:carboxymuconolactone decarboxylase family protein [Cohnella sp. GCM10027633]|uniref:carboxymuconolactone decarboxylase family protein n=1 Tax=unclassified Cohnella TaxID=2636738 RepID=UPI003631FD35
MQQRIDYVKVAPGLFQHILQLEQYIRGAGLDKKLLELVKIRVSQINGCAYCLDMHTHETRQGGESEQRIHCLPAWREAPIYSEQERLALELAEVVTLLPSNRVSDELFGRLREHWDEKGICDLVGAIITINSWNRLAVSMGNVPPIR